MKLILLICVEDHTEQKWSLLHEMYELERIGKLSFSENDGVTPVGLHAVLFDQSKAHSIYIRVCSHLLFDKKWPYFVVEVDTRSTMLVEGIHVEELQASLEKLKDLDIL